MKKRSIFLSISLALMILLSACAQPASPADQTPATNAGEQVLLVWDQFYRDEESKVMETLNAEFEAAHPGVKIQREVKVLADLQTTVKLALSNADGPDVAQVNQGRNDMGALVEAGLLLPLNPYLENTTGAVSSPPVSPAATALPKTARPSVQAIFMGSAQLRKWWVFSTIKTSSRKTAGMFPPLLRTSKLCLLK